MTIVYIEDNRDLREEIIYQLQKSGYAAIGMKNGTEILSWLTNNPQPQAILLDLGLPDIDGIELGSHIRTHYPDIIIIIVTARETTTDRIQGWKSGANAYLVKPVILRELLAVLQNTITNRNTLLGLSDQEWHLDRIHKKIIKFGAGSSELSIIEVQILQLLAQSNGEPVDRIKIIEAIGENKWEYDQRRLEAAISRLRKKLQRAGGDKEQLQSVRGKGYLFAGKIHIRN